MKYISAERIKKIFTHGLTTKLLVVNLLLSCLVFLLVGAIVFFSYYNIQGLLTTTIVKDVDENISNAGLLKDLSVVFADATLLAGTFYKNEKLLQDKGDWLVSVTKIIEQKSTYDPLKESLANFSIHLRTLFDQCARINMILRQAEQAERELGLKLSSLEKVVSDKKVAQILANEEPVFLEQLGVVISGYRDTLLQINLLFSKTSVDRGQLGLKDSVISQIDDLGLRFQTLTASEPQIAEYAAILSNALKKYRSAALQLFDAKQELEQKLVRLKASETHLISVTKELDQRITSSTLKMRHNISGIIQSTSTYILLASAIIFIVMGAVTVSFILSNIKKPMAAIKNGMESIRAGKLDTHIELHRSDEWNDIEATLNRMTSDLKSSYSELQNKNVMLETTQRELREKMQELITEEEARKRLEEQLLHAQKMEAIGQLAGGIAHDFNNILTAIMGYANMLKTKVAQDELKGFAELILSASTRAKNLTKNLLTFSRKQVMIPEPVNINEVIANIKKMLAPLIREDIELKLSLGNEELMVMADSGQIEQVLMNLTTNARDAMPHGGRLAIETACVEINAKYADSTLFARQGKHVCISVTDTGIGMVSTTREKIFEPFFTTKEVGKGTGLGLSTSYGIIKQHNGSIKVYSEPGLGTTFRIYLPLIDSIPDEKSSQESQEIRGGTETILLAEDDPDVRNLTKCILTEAGYTVLEAIDGEDAIKVFAEHEQLIDLVILDVIMPKKNGKEVYNWIIKARPEITVLFMSGYSIDLIFKKGVLEEGLHLISKPAEPHELLKKVRDLIEQKDGYERGAAQRLPVPLGPCGQRDRAKEEKRFPPACADMQDTKSKHGTIIVVDDDIQLLEYTAIFLKENGYTPYPFSNARDALDTLQNIHADAVLTDIVMPGTSGLELLETIQGINADIPVIMMTGFADLGKAVEAIKKGAFDFIMKPWESQQFLTSLDKAVRYWRLVQFKKEHEDTDPLTGLLNRRRFEPILDLEFKKSIRYSTPLSCAMIDIDHFKSVNDTYGHAAGDVVIKEVAHIIRKSIREVDVACRWGGEEFIVLTPMTEKSNTLRPAQKILQAVSEYRFPGIGGKMITVSIGIADTRGICMNAATDLIHAADTALYEAKKNGRNKIEIHT